MIIVKINPDVAQRLRKAFKADGEPTQVMIDYSETVINYLDDKLDFTPIAIQFDSNELSDAMFHSMIHSYMHGQSAVKCALTIYGHAYHALVTQTDTSTKH